ncbi:MAG: hypothetical protein ABJC26_17300, partial [Gemmatimonadaceae bacterium]
MKLVLNIFVKRSYLVSIAFVLSATIVDVAVAQNAPPVTTVKVPEVVANSTADSAAIYNLVSTARHASMTYGQLSDIAADLRELYLSNGWQPRWVKSTTASGVTAYEPTPAATELLASINLVSQRGLNANDYDAQKLPAFMLQLSTSEGRALYDVAFSANAMRLVRSLHEGRLRPSEAHAELRIPRPRYDAASVVRHIADSAHV